MSPSRHTSLRCSWTREEGIPAGALVRPGPALRPCGDRSATSPACAGHHASAAHLQRTSTGTRERSSQTTNSDDESSSEARSCLSSPGCRPPALLLSFHAFVCVGLIAGHPLLPRARGWRGSVRPHRDSLAAAVRRCFEATRAGANAGLDHRDSAPDDVGIFGGELTMVGFCGNGCSQGEGYRGV